MSEKKVWLITGAGRGLGVDIAKAALTAGHAVVATGRDATKVAAAVGDHDNLLAIKLDVTRPQDAEAAVEAAVATFGRIDILVNNAAVTRNVRLAAIKSFFRFLEYRQPAALEQIRRVLAIPFKKTDTRLVPYLLREELQAVLDAPDPATRDGIRDRAMLHVAVCAGLRVSELTGLKVDDIDLPSMSIRVLGKGRRERTLPLWKRAAAALRAWLAIRGQVATPEVFVNARCEPLSRWGFAYLLRQHAATAARKQPGLARKRVSPHVLRHTCAMIVLQATGDIRKVSLWLGHATLTTTEVYTRGDPTEKLDAMEAIVPPHLRRGVFQPTDQLIELLRRTS